MSISLANLVALYHFNEPGWTGAAGEVIDSSDLANHGVASSAVTTVPGLLGRAGDFNRASAGQVDLGDVSALELNPPFSILMWVNLRALPSIAGGSYRLISKSDANGNQREWAVSINGATDVVEFSSDPDGSLLLDYPVIPFLAADVDQWVHIALVVSATGELVGYKDGLATGTDTINPTIFHGSARAFIGRRNPSGRASDARLDEIAVFSRALSDAEVLTVATSQGSGDPASEL